ncbi:MAG: hypothetical protein PHR00_00620 [Patescibacteria group bacterium]|nr:hypothetical protein [Patescibacteria group bacterium]
MKTLAIIVSTIIAMTVIAIICLTALVSVANVTFTEVNVEDLGNGFQKVTTITSVYDDVKEDYVNDTTCVVIDKRTGSKTINQISADEQVIVNILVDATSENRTNRTTHR